MSDDWTFLTVKGLSGDLSKYTKLYFKLEDFTNSVENKLTLYFKENKGNTQSMDYVSKVEITPDANGEFELDLTAFDWKNNANPSETIDKTKIYDVTLYGGARTDESEVGSVKITEAWLEFPDPDPFDTSKNHMLLVTNGAAKSNPWDYQAQYTLPAPLVSGKTYVIEFAINAVNGGETRVVPNGDGAQYLDTKGLWTNKFTKYQIEFEANGNHTKLEIDLGACGGEVYFENISLKEKDTDVNLIANGDFEELGLEGWSGVGNSITQVEQEAPVEVLDPGMLISVGEAGWKTFRTGSAIKITDPNVTAYVAKYIEAGNYIKLTEVTEIPGWQPVFIEAASGSYMVEIIAEATGFPWDDNGLKANGPSALPGDGTLYGLAKKNDVVGFYKISSESAVPAWAIYMQITSSSAPGFLGFGDNATNIEVVKSVKNNGEFFNLAGQRVANPTKGLYIVNGKKYIVK